jgi:glycosyltransferase involved in cell wall biosynthesis
MDISIVVPVYNEEESLPELETWIREVMQKNKFSYEVLMIDDGSRDTSWEVIQSLAQQNECIKGVKFNKNYGKSAALHIGFEHAQGDVVITMDADLQDSPEEVPELYRMIMQDKFDLVSGWKKKRNDPLSKTIPTKLYNAVTRLFSGIKLHDFNCGLKAYRLEVVKNIEVYGEMHRYIPIIAKWAGFDKIGEKVVQHQARKYGKSKFGWERFINGFLDLLSITFVSRFRKKPMQFFGRLGALSFLLGFGLVVYLVYLKVYGIWYKLPVREITEKPAFYMALVAIILGVQLFLAGFLGEMIVQGADKNDYIIKQKVGV